jgi:hypothetical protein
MTLGRSIVVVQCRHMLYMLYIQGFGYIWVGELDHEWYILAFAFDIQKSHKLRVLHTVILLSSCNSVAPEAD